MELKSWQRVRLLKGIIHRDKCRGIPMYIGQIKGMSWEKRLRSYIWRRTWSEVQGNEGKRAFQKGVFMFGSWKLRGQGIGVSSIHWFWQCGISWSLDWCSPHGSPGQPGVGRGVGGGKGGESLWKGAENSKRGCGPGACLKMRTTRTCLRVRKKSDGGGRGRPVHAV